MESLSAANTQFSLNVFEKISEINTSGNVFYSPLSISLALAMVSLGAKENTKDQILQVLCLKKSEPALLQMKIEDLPICVKADRPMMPNVQEIKQSDIPVCVKGDPPIMHEIKKSDIPVCVKGDPPKMHEIKKSDIPVCVKGDPPKMHEIKKSDIPVCVKSQSEPMMQQTPKPQEPVKSQCQPPKLQKPLEPQISSHLKQEDQIHSSYNKLMSELNKPGVPYMLSLANRLYGEKSYQFIDKFISDTKKYYKAGLESVDFIKNSEAARVNINKWVEKTTQGKIKDLLAQGIVNDLTRLVLVNAIYFKGNWEKKFPKEATVDQQFKVNKNETKPVKMMKQTSKFLLAFIPEVNSQILELPYVGKNLSMFIILPNEIEDDTTGLQQLEKTLTYEKLMEWTKRDNMSVEKIQISLPKFKLEETYNMKNLLVKLGMADAFEKGKANFSGMSPKNDLVVSEVIHKSFVEVNEEGTEAAAATGVVMGLLSMPPQFFNADHPFLFFIRHNPTNTILFYGRFCSP
ncbi:leukocyte elastase inhibitor-like isoform X1 [Misgurnus anguillicaudatus]|uniref:leukocyte elastase inhibitor-like isoform X1 n=1 Tax=Misgurnus anguillicaudatus TaxID=75329 RepID=UPI003CCF9538